MSTILPEAVSCASCGAALTAERAYSVNAVRRPEHKAAILDGSLQRLTCAACGAVQRLEPALTYLDIEVGQWILVEPAANQGEWAALEEAARRLYESRFGAAAPAAARAIAAGIAPRVVFGWSALVEKLLCADHGIEDTSLELLKLAILRGGAPLADEVELRLVSVEDDTLTLAWIHQPEGGQGEQIRVDRTALTDLDEADWDELRDELGQGLYVDVNRLLIESVAETD